LWQSGRTRNAQQRKSPCAKSFKLFGREMRLDGGDAAGVDANVGQFMRAFLRSIASLARFSSVGVAMLRSRNSLELKLAV
jgi:hypothetical protein